MISPLKPYPLQAAFEPEMLDSGNNGRTMGLGSGSSDYAKDCGYQMDTNAKGFFLMSNGTLTPYGGDVRSRLISNALLFAAQCWGHLAIANTPSMTVCHSNYTCVTVCACERYCAYLTTPLRLPAAGTWRPSSPTYPESAAHVRTRTSALRTSTAASHLRAPCLLLALSRCW